MSLAAPNRRHLLAAGAAAALVPGLPRAAPDQDAPLRALLDRMLGETLRDDPALATTLGLDEGDLAWTRSSLIDRSFAATQARKARAAAEAEALSAIDPAALSPARCIDRDTMLYDRRTTAEAARFAYGAGEPGAPYVLSQLTGAYQETPDFLDSAHTIQSKADADAYLARLAAFARLIDQETELARADHAEGAAPPDFALDTALKQLRALAGEAPEASTLVDSLTRRAAAAGLAGDWQGRARSIVEQAVRPALARQIALLEEARKTATHAAGVGRLKDGEAYYAMSLRHYTTSDWSPERIHETGLELVKSLSAQTDAAMKAQGFTKGTVGERFRALYTDPKFHYPNTDAGKAKLIADLNAKIEVIQAKSPAWFGTLPKAKVEIRRVPAATEAGAASGSYTSGSLDGARPGVFWINLRDTAEVPSWSLPTFAYHETIPGHHLQVALANEQADMPVVRNTINFSGYVEGWALYAEQLAVEMGLYDDDPMARIGMLHDALFRAVRLVVDTGLHAKGWSREQAIAWYVAALGDHEAVAVSEIERYCVWPGQACSYMLGKLTWLGARERAQKALRRRFDIRRFHDAGLLIGATPLTVLGAAIDRYIAAAKG